MKKISLLISLLISINFAFAQKATYGYVNRDKIFNDMPETNKALEKLKNAQKKYTDYLTQMQDEYKQKLKVLQSKKDSLPKIIFNEKVDELKALEKKMNDFKTKAQQDLLKQKDDLLTPSKNKLNQAIEAVRKERAYDFIIDNSNLIIISTNGKFDIEADVRKKLNLPASK